MKQTVILLFTFLSCFGFSQSARKQNVILKAEYDKQLIEYNLLCKKVDSLNSFRNELISNNLWGFPNPKKILININEYNDKLQNYLSKLKVDYDTSSIQFNIIADNINKLANELSEIYLNDDEIKHKKTYLVKYSKFSDTLPTLKTKKQNALLLTLIDSLIQLNKSTFSISNEITNSIKHHENLEIPKKKKQLQDEIYSLQGINRKLEDLLIKEKNRYAQNGPKGFSNAYKEVFPDVFLVKNEGLFPVPEKYEEAYPAPPDPEPIIYDYVNEDPYFPGGKNELLKYLSLNIKYPKNAIDNGIQGKCYIKFVVNKAGEISKTRITKGIEGCPECDKEALRVIKKMPNWIPAKLDGKIVDSYYTLPISFDLN